MKALLLVDLQNDFCPGGKLPVNDGDKIIPIANSLIDKFEYVIATKDWHPEDHLSFASNHEKNKIGDQVSINGLLQTLWPSHCVQNSDGSDFHPLLKTEKFSKIIYKGMDRNIDSYSAFFDNAHLKSTELKDFLESINVKDLYIMGLATDYCVKFSVLDAIQLGFNVYIIKDGCRGVELNSGDCEKAFDEMQQRGAKIVYSNEIEMLKC